MPGIDPARLRWPFAILVIVLFGAPLFLMIKELSLKVFTAAQFGSFIGTLVGVAFFIERAVEVLVSPVRDPEKAKLEVGLQEKFASAEANFATNPMAPPEADPEVVAARAALSAYVGQTRQLASGLALALGWLISLVGIRALYFLIDTSKTPLPEGFQGNTFHLIDLFITGTVLAGGSKGLHDFTQLAKVYLEKATEASK